MRWRIVIVNYRTGELATAAARSARSTFQSTDHVIVVDSASGDDSCEQLRLLKDVELLALKQNRGFAAALNAGAATGDHNWDVLLGMNADVLLPPEIRQAFERRLTTLEQLGVLAPRLLSPDGTPQPSCRNFPTHRNLLASRTGFGRRDRSPVARPYVPAEPPAFTLCDVVAGACFAIRRTAWEQLGGMDEQFFLYAEDTDFCRRAKSAGWLVGYEPAVVARHEWRASTSQNRKQSARLHAQSLAKYFAKHFPDRPWANRTLRWLMHAYTAFTPEP